MARIGKLVYRATRPNATGPRFDEIEIGVYLDEEDSPEEVLERMKAWALYRLEQRELFVARNARWADRLRVEMAEAEELAAATAERIRSQMAEVEAKAKEMMKGKVFNSSRGGAE